MGKVAPLKFTAKLVCIQSLLDFADETSKSKRKQMIGYFATGCYSAVSEDVLRRLIDHYPAYLTNQILEALMPHHVRELKLKKCTGVSVNGLRSVLESQCPHLSMIDLTECDQFAVPMLFTQMVATDIQLTALSLESCLHVNDKVVKTILKQIHTLQHLNISSCDITDRAFLLNEELQLGRELCEDVNDERREKYECKLISIDLSGCRNISSTAIRHVCTLCGPTLKNVNIAWTGVDCMSLLYLSGFNLPAVVQLFLNLDSNKSQKFPTELEDCLQELHKTMEKMNKSPRSHIDNITKNPSNNETSNIEDNLVSKSGQSECETLAEDAICQGLTKDRKSVCTCDCLQLSKDELSLHEKQVDSLHQNKMEDITHNTTVGMDNSNSEKKSKLNETFVDLNGSLFESLSISGAVCTSKQLDDKTDLGIDEISLTFAEQNTCSSGLKSTEDDNLIVEKGMGNFHTAHPSLVHSDITSECSECLKSNSNRCLQESNISDIDKNDFHLSQNGACDVSQNSFQEAILNSQTEKQEASQNHAKVSIFTKKNGCHSFNDIKSDKKLQKHICDINCDNKKDVSSVGSNGICQNSRQPNLNLSDSKCDICNSVQNMVKNKLQESSSKIVSKKFKEKPDMVSDSSNENYSFRDGFDVKDSSLHGADKKLQLNDSQQILLSSRNENCQTCVCENALNSSSKDSVLYEHASSFTKVDTHKLKQESVYAELKQDPEKIQIGQTSDVDSHKEILCSEKLKENEGLASILTKSCSTDDTDSLQMKGNVSVIKMFQPSLLSIDISSIQFIDESVGQECLKTFLQANSSLQKFCISWKCFSDQMLDFLASTLTDVREVTLVDCDSLTTVGISDLGSKCHNLRKVDLKGVYNIKNLAVYPFLKLPYLESLCLAECGITDGTLFRIGARCSEKIKELDLSWCDDITEKGINFLCSKCLKLQSLSLRHCPASNLTLALIAENFKDLRYINLCSIDTVDDESVINLVQNLNFLEIIDLSWNSGLEDRSITALLSNCIQLKTAILSGLKRITSQPFLPIISELDKWRRCQKLIKFKLKEREVLQSSGDLQDSSEEEFEDLYMPHRSTVYAPNLRVLDLEYCDRLTDHHLAEIVAVCRGSLEIIDYYSEAVKPALFNK